MVDVKWKLEEYTATFGDDDLAYRRRARRSRASSRRTSTVPTRKRSGERNNIGDVWVVGRARAETRRWARTKPLRARAHLLVTVPVYMRLDGRSAETVARTETRDD